MANPIKVFISYSHRDEKYKDELNKWLIPYETNGIIQVWDDRNILPGEDWDQEINKRLMAADVVLYLVSPDFMASRYITNVELKKAIDRHNTGEQRLVPIIIRPSNLALLNINNLQAVPKDAKPISSWDNQDEAWYDVSNALGKLFVALQKGEIVLNDSNTSTASSDASTDTPSKPANATSTQQADPPLILSLADIKGLIIRDRLSDAVNGLLQLTEQPKYEYYNNSVIMQSASLSELKGRVTNGVITADQASTSRAKIRMSLLNILEGMEKE